MDLHVNEKMLGLVNPAAAAQINLAPGVMLTLHLDPRIEGGGDFVIWQILQGMLRISTRVADIERIIASVPGCTALDALAPGDDPVRLALARMHAVLTATDAAAATGKGVPQ